MTSRNLLSLLATLFTVASSSACSVLLADDSPACRVDADCAQHGPNAVCASGLCSAGDSLALGSRSDAAAAALDPLAADPVWGCLGRVSWPPEDPSREVTVTGDLKDLVSRGALAGFTVKSCSGLDLFCASPRAQVTTDVDGRYTLRERYGFRGYLQLEPPAGSAILPAIVEANPPPFGDIDYGSGINALLLPTQAALAGLLGLIEEKLDPEAGHYFGLAVDCQNRPVRGVTLHASPVMTTSVSYYSDESDMPSRTLTETAGNGTAGYVNLKPGPVTFTYSVGSRQVGSVSVQIRKGAITAGFLPPTPLE